MIGTTADLLGDFCRALMERDDPPKRLSPVFLADAFVDFFDLSTFPRMEEITTLLRRSGVGIVVRSNLDNGRMRGVHTGIKNGPYVIQLDDEWNGAQEHTVLHETYEILRERLHDLFPRMARARGETMCWQADAFAAAVLMQPEFFSLFAETTGLDVVALQKTYGRAYSSLTLRLAEVMKHQPLMSVLYEREEEGTPHQWSVNHAPSQFIAKVVARTPGFRLRLRNRPLSCLRGLLPRRGSPPAPCSVAERVILTGRSVYIERVSGYDLWRADDISVAARPVRWHGRLAKVCLVAVPYRDRSVLSPQLGQASFEHIPEAYQVI